MSEATKAPVQQWLEARGLGDLSLYWPTHKPIPQIDYESGEAKPTLTRLMEEYAAYILEHSEAASPDGVEEGETCDHGVPLDKSVRCTPCFELALDGAMDQAESGSAAHIRAGAPFSECKCRVCEALKERAASPQGTPTADLPETVSSTEKLVTCKGQPEPHIRIHACREPIVEVEALLDKPTVRQRIYAFMQLPHHVQHERARQLGLLDPIDCSLVGSELLLEWIKRAKDKTCADELIDGNSAVAAQPKQCPQCGSIQTFGYLPGCLPENHHVWHSPVAAQTCQQARKTPESSSRTGGIAPTHVEQAGSNSAAQKEKP